MGVLVLEETVDAREGVVSLVGVATVVLTQVQSRLAFLVIRVVYAVQLILVVFHVILIQTRVLF